MKKTWNGEYLQGLEVLTEREECTIEGGESIWYWMGYAVGWVAQKLLG